MDALLLHALAGKTQLASLRSAVPDNMVGQDTVALLGWYSAYFNAFPDRDTVEPEELKSLVRLRAGDAPAEAIAMTMHLIDQLKTKPDETAIKGLLGQLYTLDMSGRAGALLEKYNTGGEVDLVYEMQKLVQESSQRMSSASVVDFVRDDIGELLAKFGQDQGLKFTFISQLMTGMRGLIAGDSGMFAARVDAGKSSFLCKMATAMAPQVPKYFQEGQPILFLVNESEGNRMIPRLRQAALNLTVPQMIEWHNAGRLEQAYREALGGTPIEIKNIHGWTVAQVERFVQQVKPAMFITDMPANLRMSISGNKTDALEETWQHLRDLAVMEKCIHIGTAQISVEGADQLYPPMTALKDTKTGVQGALDFQINMGNLNNPMAQTLRGISTPKNKLSMAGQPSNVQTEVVFLKDTCQFNDGAGGAPAAA